MRDAADVDERDAADRSEHDSGVRQHAPVRAAQARRDVAERSRDAAAGEKIGKPQQRARDIAGERAERSADVAIRAAARRHAAAAFGEADRDRADRNRADEKRDRRIRPTAAASDAGTAKMPAPTTMLTMLAAKAQGPRARTSPASRVFSPTDATIARLRAALDARPTRRDVFAGSLSRSLRQQLAAGRICFLSSSTSGAAALRFVVAAGRDQRQPAPRAASRRGRARSRRRRARSRLFLSTLTSRCSKLPCDKQRRAQREDAQTLRVRMQRQDRRARRRGDRAIDFDERIFGVEHEEIRIRDAAADGQRRRRAIDAHRLIAAHLRDERRWRN